MKSKAKPKEVGSPNSIYKIVITAATRAIELGEGSRRLVDAKPTESVLDVALKEIKAGKVSYKIKEDK
ncbi:MAG: DNA-directed RNA polymerase subunit omega [Candidatus Omnitrophica bacterium]|nr:DNA-directed RNA polymerase subunit omega [Candidatus Omnitrophota bacterium]